MTGWIKLHRQIREWEWYDDLPCFRLFTHLLITCNFEDSKYRGYEVPAGSKVVGISTLSSQTGLSQMQIRTAIKKLIYTNEITIKTTNKFSIISITKWDSYQTNNKQITNNQQTDNKPITTSKEGKKEEGKKEINNIILTDDGRFLSPEQFCNELWIEYPSVGRGKGHKGKFVEQVKKHLKKGVNHEEIRRGVTEYSQYCQATGQLNQDAFRWARDCGWETEYKIPDAIEKKPSYINKLANASKSAKASYEADNTE